MVRNVKGIINKVKHVWDEQPSVPLCWGLIIGSVCRIQRPGVSFVWAFRDLSVFLEVLYALSSSSKNVVCALQHVPGVTRVGRAPHMLRD